jgi:phage tail P2-like protein
MVKTKDLLTVNLQGDKNIEGLCSAIDKVFTLENDLSKLLVYLIDQVEESALPFLAWQFHIEGYEQAQTIQEKRNLIKHAIELHRYKGTPYAIKKVFQALNLEAELTEWFDYNGDPYRFKVLVKSIIPDEDTYLRLIELINEYKNVRSWLDAIGFHRELTHNIYYAFAQKDGKHYQINLHVDIHPSVEQTTLYTALAQRTGTSYRIGLYEPQTSVEQTTLYAGIAQRAGTSYQIGLYVDPTSVEQATLYTALAQRVATSYHIGVYEPQVSVEPYTFYTGIAQRVATYMAIYPAN